MAKPPRILAFCGSARRESLNRKFLALGVEAARQAGCDVTVAELRDLALPLYDGDLEDRDGMPAGATTLVGLIASCDGLLLKLGCVVVPGQCVLPHAGAAFDASGRLKDERPMEALRQMAQRLAALASRLAA
jgi:hypothetical protein